MRLPLVVVLILAIACASGGSSAATSSSPVASTTTPTPAAAPMSQAFVGTYERLWRALPDAYASLGIKVNVADTSTRAVGFAGTVRRKLGFASLSTYFDCGMAQTDVIADSYELSVVVASQVGKSPQGKILVTTSARATARSPQFAHDVATCVSKGRVEKALFDSLRARVP